VAAVLAVGFFGNGGPLLAERWRMVALYEPKTEAETAEYLLERASRAAPWQAQYRIDLANFEAVRAVNLQQSAPADGAAERAFSAAERHLGAAIAREPDELQWRYALGMLYHFWGRSDPARYAEAECVYRSAAAASPRRQRTFWLWGDLLLAQGKRREAESMYRRALELDPRVASAHGAMAMLYDRLGQPAMAERYRRSARALRRTALVIVPHAPPGSAESSTPIP
jgi:tetratricopeptide (TPR) repeat protein